MVQAASVSIHKAHGQYIENVHLETYSSEEHFWEVLYKLKYTRILRKAREYLDHTGGPGDDVMVFIRFTLFLIVCASLLTFRTAVVWTHANTSSTRCRVTIARSPHRSTIDFPEMLAS